MSTVRATKNGPICWEVDFCNVVKIKTQMRQDGTVFKLHTQRMCSGMFFEITFLNNTNQDPKICPNGSQ